MAPDPLLSVCVGTNSDLLAAIQPLYLPDGSTVADTTFGLGVFWRKVDLSRITLLATDIAVTERNKAVAEELDINLACCDMRKLPYADASIDVVVIDPPYIHSPGQHTTDARYNNAATTRHLYFNDILEQIYFPTLDEAKRVLRTTRVKGQIDTINGFILVKCMDQVQGGIQESAFEDISAYARSIGLYRRDYLVLASTSKTPKGRWARQLHARKIHSFLLVFEVATKRTAVGRRTYRDNKKLVAHEVPAGPVPEGTQE